jgi:hypothetical protein
VGLGLGVRVWGQGVHSHFMKSECGGIGSGASVGGAGSTFTFHEK